MDCFVDTKRPFDTEICRTHVWLLITERMKWALLLQRSPMQKMWEVNTRENSLSLMRFGPGFKWRHHPSLKNEKTHFVVQLQKTGPPGSQQPDHLGNRSCWLWASSGKKMQFFFFFTTLCLISFLMSERNKGVYVTTAALETHQVFLWHPPHQTSEKV